MADKKISQLTTLAQADVAVTADFLPIVDTSATETKKATPQALVQAGATGATLAVALGAVTTPSYTFTGDLNTGVWSPAADTISLSTAGLDRLRIDSSGNVGIGTANSAPRGDLDVGHNSTALTTRSLHIGYSGGNFYGYRATNTNTAGSTAAGDFFLERGTTSAWVTDFNIDDNGNVTIGGGALATTATNRFFYAPTCAGVPTGVPTTKTGFAPVVIDTTNHRLYFYSGGSWRNAGP